MIFEFVIADENRLNVTSDEDIHSLAARHSRDIVGPCTNHRLRPELRGQPIVTDMIGPMWGGIRDGQPVIRYEDSEAYSRLST
ncbi:MAG: hypothetical protein M9924_21160 [Rhizobiaceae bacterium]|nr:hypothetical protein [Rhizobiaceae bacterium]